MGYGDLGWKSGLLAGYLKEGKKKEERIGSDVWLKVGHKGFVGRLTMGFSPLQRSSSIFLKGRRGIGELKVMLKLFGVFHVLGIWVVVVVRYGTLVILDDG